MSYATGTTHYNLPQTVGTDKRDWTDTNQAFADVDAALYGAVTDAQGAATDVSYLATRVTTVEGDMVDVKNDIATLQANDTTQDTAILNLQNAVTNLQANDTTQDTAILNLQNAVTNLQESVIATVTTDGVETMSQTYNRLFALVPSTAAFDEMRYKIEMPTGEIYYDILYSHSPSEIVVTSTLIVNNGIHTDTIRMKSANSTREVGHLDSNGYTYTDRSSDVFAANTKIYLIVH